MAASVSAALFNWEENREAVLNYRDWWGKMQRKNVSFSGAVPPESFTGLTLFIPSSDEHI